jgi:hypothetical protein
MAKSNVGGASRDYLAYRAGMIDVYVINIQRLSWVYAPTAYVATLKREKDTRIIKETQHAF